MKETFYEFAVYLTLITGQIDVINYEKKYETKSECVKAIQKQSESVAIIINSRVGGFVDWDVDCRKNHNI